MPMRQLRDAWPRGWPSVRSSAYDRPDRIDDSLSVAVTDESKTPIKPRFCNTFGHCARLQVRVNLLPVVPSLIRKAAAALAVAVPCVLLVSPADASPVRKAHSRPHKVISHRKVVTPAQSFARLLNRRPEKRLVRHPQTWLKHAPHAAESPTNEAAIQTSSAPASAEVRQDVPALQPLELLVPVQAQFSSHDGFAHRSPRAPPSLG